MTAPVITDPKLVIPTREDFEKLLTAKLSYEAKQNTPERDTWNKKHFNETPWGIAYNCSKAKYDKSVAAYQKTNKGKTPVQKFDITLRYFIVAVTIDWKELIDQLKRTIKNWGYTSQDLQNVAKNVWLTDADYISNLCGSVTTPDLIEQIKTSSSELLTEAVEKHDNLNTKLFTKDGVLKDKVRDKMLEIVDEFLTDLKEQDIKIKVDDILFIGSNASYNYTKDSDLDIHIIADTSEIADTLNLYKVIYNAYKSAFNRKFEIELNKVPVELYVETQDTPLVSNGIYSVMNDTWVKEPTKEDIPEVDQEAIDKAFKPWEKRYKALVANTTDEVKDETEIDKLITKLYELRQAGLSSEGEYSIGNLVFKEMRNKGYLDALKELRHKVISQRLSLHEGYSYRLLTEKERRDYYNKINQLTHYQPQIQPNGLFELYNVKEVDLAVVLSNLRRQPEVEYARQSAERLDFSRINYQGIPARLYRIIGKISLN